VTIINRGPERDPPDEILVPAGKLPVEPGEPSEEPSPQPAEVRASRKKMLDPFRLAKLNSLRLALKRVTSYSPTVFSNSD